MMMSERPYRNAATGGPLDPPSEDRISAGIHVNRRVPLAEYEKQVPECVQRRSTEGCAFGADVRG
jgi:hypothetical protein